MMLEYLPSKEDVIAIRCGGKLKRAELETYMDRLEASLAQREQTHLFAEVVEFGGLDTDGLGNLMKRSAVWFRNLDRVGRVAIVADQSWIRWAAKLESAVLPHVSYETFESDERERAWAWVQGETDRPHGPALRIIETDRPEALAFEIDGHLDKGELDAASAHFVRAVEGLDRVRVLGRIRRLDGFEASGLLSGDFFAMKRSFLERMERYAIVGGPSWLKATLNSLGPLFRVEIRHFAAEEEAEAWSWIGAKPVSERTLFD
jgi:hypothetical protein